MGGLGRPGSLLRSVYEHEKEIKGTEEEIRYYSHDSSEQLNDNATGGIQIFKVDEEPNKEHSGECEIFIVNRDGDICGAVVRKSPTTISIFNEIAQKYEIKNYVLKDIEGKIITGVGSYSVKLPEVYLEDIDYAIFEFNHIKKRKQLPKKIKCKPKLSKEELIGKIKEILDEWDEDTKIDHIKELIEGE